jgi:hypothetical protein
MAYCEISHKKGHTKGTICNSWDLRPHNLFNDTADIIADCLENQFRAYDLCDYNHRQHVEAQVEALLATVNEENPLISNPVTSQKKYNP